MITANSCSGGIWPVFHLYTASKLPQLGHHYVGDYLFVSPRIHYETA